MKKLVRSELRTDLTGLTGLNQSSESALVRPSPVIVRFC